MSDAAAVQAMEALQSCRCCLRRPPEKGLKTLYDTLGKTENYWDMLKECFDIHLNVGNDECGICEMCVARLRDATEFKLQVQQSQVQLKALLEKALQEKDKKPNLIKVELVEDDPNADETMIQDSGSVKSEGEGDLVSSILYGVETLYGAPVSGDIDAPYECQACEKLFQHEDSLRRHVFAVHSKVTPLEHDLIPLKTYSTEHGGTQGETSGRWCGLCEKFLSSRYSLKMHMVVHSGDKPYACEVCNKKFAYKHNARVHLKCHADYRRYGCEKCEEKFKEISELKKHELVHKEVYSCDVCMKRVKSSKHLNMHMQVHKDDKPRRSRRQGHCWNISQRSLRSRSRK